MAAILKNIELKNVDFKLSNKKVYLEKNFKMNI